MLEHLSSAGLQPDDLDTIWYLIVSRATGTPATEAQHVAHRAWLRSQHAAGRLILSGPSVDRSTGIYVVFAPSEQAAAGLVAADPYHVDRIREPEIIPWQVRRSLRLTGPTPAELSDIASGSRAEHGSTDLRTERQKGEPT